MKELCDRYCPSVCLGARLPQNCEIFWVELEGIRGKDEVIRLKHPIRGVSPREQILNASMYCHTV